MPVEIEPNGEHFDLETVLAFDEMILAFSKDVFIHGAWCFLGPREQIK